MVVGTTAGLHLHDAADVGQLPVVGRRRQLNGIAIGGGRVAAAHDSRGAVAHVVVGVADGLTAHERGAKGQEQKGRKCFHGSMRLFDAVFFVADQFVVQFAEFVAFPGLTGVEAGFLDFQILRTRLAEDAAGLALH